jgi:hypothetical protein
MANPLGSPQYLRKEPAKWKHLPTKAIRIPEVFADRLLAIASKLDASECTTELEPESFISSRGLKKKSNERTVDYSDTAKIVEILTAALGLKADDPEAIQAEIRKALKLIEEQTND